MGVERGNYGTSAKSSSHAESSCRLKEFTEGAVTIGVRSQYSTMRIEKGYFLRRCRLGSCRTLKGWPLKPGRTGGIKKRLGSRSSPPENILYTNMRSPRRRRPSQHSRSTYDSRRKPFTSLVANRWVCSRQLASTTRFGEQACIAYSRWGRTNVL